MFKILFQKFSSTLIDVCYWKSCVAYLTKKQNFAWLSSCRYCADCTQNLPGLVPDNVQSAPDFIQVGSLSAELNA